MKTTPEAMTPLLVQVSGRLDEPQSLSALADAFGASPFQFHRRFSAATGETPARHVKRLRLERAAYLLAVTEQPVLEVALAVGFTTHEAFTRAFRRRFDCTPRGYRQAARAAQRTRMAQSVGFAGQGCRISEVRFDFLPARTVLAVRRIGPYAREDRAARAGAWAELEARAAGVGARCGAERLGLYPDDPTLTPAALQQSDLAIAVSTPAAGDGRVRTLRVGGGLHAMIEHLGPHHTLPQAYGALADAVRLSGRYALTEGPPLHFFLDETAAPEAVPSRICFPVRRR